MTTRLCLVLGGVRSGKSAFAESKAVEFNQAADQTALYVATGVAFDGEMKDRILRHKESRPQEWPTLEEPVKLTEKISSFLQKADSTGVVIIDSIDVWVANLLMGHQTDDSQTQETIVIGEVDKLLNLMGEASQAFLLVSSEVGLSLVPPEPLGRRFQDFLGTVNQRIATAAIEVYLIVAGIPLKIKSANTE